MTQVLETRCLNFSERCKEALLKNRATIFRSEGEVIEDIEKAKIPLWYEDQYSQTQRIKGLFNIPLSPMEIAIFTDPEMTFVPDSFNRIWIERMRAKVTDQQVLEDLLGRKDFDSKTFPELPRVLQITCRKFSATEGRMQLLGREYGCNYIGTSTLIPDNGSFSLARPHRKLSPGFASIGRWNGYGLGINLNFRADSASSSLGDIRWLIPSNTD